jgi:hypothetical protein
MTPRFREGLRRPKTKRTMSKTRTASRRSSENQTNRRELHAPNSFPGSRAEPRHTRQGPPSRSRRRHAFAAAHGSSGPATQASLHASVRCPSYSTFSGAIPI